MRSPLFFRSAILLAQVALIGGLLTACATRPTDPEDLAAYQQANDPLEPLNRHIFNFNRGVDFWLLRPTTQLYRFVVPAPVREAVHNFLNNLDSPLVIANELLQGNPQRAGRAAERFAMNTVVGIGGLFDVAAKNNLPPIDDDFGQTLAIWGIGDGPYLMLPLLGPSDPRDATGLAVDYVADPVDLYLERHGVADGWIYARTGAEVVDARSNNLKTFDQIERTSLDYYAVVRSLYRQHRTQQIKANSEPESAAAAPAPTKADTSRH